MCNVLAIKWWSYTTQPVVSFSLLFLSLAGAFHKYTFLLGFFSSQFKTFYLFVLFICMLILLAYYFYTYYCFSSAYLYFHILLSLIIPWLQWLPLLWGIYTCSEWFPEQESQKHSGLFYLGRLMPQTYSVLFFTSPPMFKLNSKQSRQAKPQTNWLCTFKDLLTKNLGSIFGSSGSGCLESSSLFCPIEITARRTHTALWRAYLL